MKREDLPQVADKFEMVPVPEMAPAAQIKVVAPTLTQYTQFVAGLQRDRSEGAKEAPGFVDGSARILGLCCVDEDGQPLADAAYWDQIARTHRPAVERLAGVAFRLLDLGAVEVKKTSSETPS
jgi:hypothetical protein